MAGDKEDDIFSGLDDDLDRAFSKAGSSDDNSSKEEGHEFGSVPSSEFIPELDEDFDHGDVVEFETEPEPDKTEQPSRKPRHRKASSSDRTTESPPPVVSSSDSEQVVSAELGEGLPAIKMQEADRDGSDKPSFMTSISTKLSDLFSLLKAKKEAMDNGKASGEIDDQSSLETESSEMVEGGSNTSAFMNQKMLMSSAVVLVLVMVGGTFYSIYSKHGKGGQLASTNLVTPTPLAPVTKARPGLNVMSGKTKTNVDNVAAVKAGERVAKKEIANNDAFMSSSDFMKDSPRKLTVPKLSLAKLNAASLGAALPGQSATAIDKSGSTLSKSSVKEADMGKVDMVGDMPKPKSIDSIKTESSPSSKGHKDKASGHSMKANALADNGTQPSRHAFDSSYEETNTANVNSGSATALKKQMAKLQSSVERLTQALDAMKKQNQSAYEADQSREKLAYYLPNIKLIAIIQHGLSYEARVQIPGAPAQYVVEGSKVRAWTIDRVDSDRVYLLFGSYSKILQLPDQPADSSYSSQTDDTSLLPAVSSNRMNTEYFGNVGDDQQN